MNTNNKKELDQLTRSLDRRDLVDWAAGMELGAPAFDHLFRLAASENGSTHLRRNAARAVFRLRGRGTASKVLSLLCSLCVAEQREIRSVGATLLIGLSRLGEVTATEVRAVVERARSAGLETDADALVDAFLSGNLPAWEKSPAQSSVAPDGSPSLAPPGAPSSAPRVNADIGPAPESDDGDDKKGQ